MLAASAHELLAQDMPRDTDPAPPKPSADDHVVCMRPLQHTCADGLQMAMPALQPVPTTPMPDTPRPGTPPHGATTTTCVIYRACTYMHACIH